MRSMDKKERREKRARTLEMEKRRLWVAHRNLGFKKLEKPIRDGWFKHLALRDDISRRKDAHVFQNIIDNCGMDFWGASKKEADRVWDKYYKKNKYAHYPGLIRPFGEKWKGMSPKARLWFDGLDWVWVHSSGYVKRYFCKVPSYYFVTTYSKAFITKKQVVNPDLDSQIDQIENKLNSNEFYRFNHDRHYSGWWMSDFYHKKVRRRVKSCLQNYEEERFDRNVYRDFNH